MKGYRIDYSPKPAYTGQSITVTGTASDASGIKQLTVGFYTLLRGDTLASNTCTTSPCSASYTFSTAGTYSYGATAVDNANNQNTAGSSISVSEPVNGQCGTTLNSCAAGTFQDAADTSTEYKWNCLGIGGGTTASCSLAICSSSNCGACTSPNAQHQ